MALMAGILIFTRYFFCLAAAMLPGLAHGCLIAGALWCVALASANAILASGVSSVLRTWTPRLITSLRAISTRS